MPVDLRMGQLTGFLEHWQSLLDDLPSMMEGAVRNDIFPNIVLDVLGRTGSVPRRPNEIQINPHITSGGGQLSATVQIPLVAAGDITGGTLYNRFMMIRRGSKMVIFVDDKPQKEGEMDIRQEIEDASDRDISGISQQVLAAFNEAIGK